MPPVVAFGVNLWTARQLVSQINANDVVHSCSQPSALAAMKAATNWGKPPFTAKQRSSWAATNLTYSVQLMGRYFPASSTRSQTKTQTQISTPSPTRTSSRTPQRTLSDTRGPSQNSVTQTGTRSQTFAQPIRSLSNSATRSISSKTQSSSTTKTPSFTQAQSDTQTTSQKQSESPSRALSHSKTGTPSLTQSLSPTSSSSQAVTSSQTLTRSQVETASETPSPSVTVSQSASSSLSQASSPVCNHRPSCVNTSTGCACDSDMLDCWGDNICRALNSRAYCGCFTSCQPFQVCHLNSCVFSCPIDTIETVDGGCVYGTELATCGNSLLVSGGFDVCGPDRSCVDFACVCSAGG
jgi:hypothetical protein